ncbi:MAG: NEAT domain-containing protein [Clostridia bacterium]|nr:NEAT domain-containing protein [Clostridia bacterium]
MKHTVRKLLALMMALSLGLIMTGMTALAASAASGAPLKDGDYTVNVQLWHASKDQASMAASCVKETADVTVKNGKATMTVHTQPMSMAGITASMQTMSVKQPNGKMKAADIVEVTDGNPTAFRFEVPSWDEYIVLEVNPKIEIMGNKPMDARLKVDWASAKPAKGTDATTSATAKGTKAADPLSGLLSMLPKPSTPDATSSASKTDANSSATKSSEAVPAEETSKSPVADRLSTLTQKPADKNNLSDGTYTVGVKLWHSEKDQASMAASSLKPEAKIVVENGNATMYIYTQPMTMGNITASLQEMKVQMKDGSWKDASVSSTSKDGNPTSFKFTLPHTDEYINVQVNPHVEMMGNRFLDARIKVDWASLKTTAVTGTEDPNGASTTTATAGTSNATTTADTETTYDGVRANGVDTGEHTDWVMMAWYAVAVGALTFAVCFAVLKRGLV